MTKNAAVAPAKPNGLALRVVQGKDETEEAATARAMLSPVTSSGLTAFGFHPLQIGRDLNGLMGEITRQVALVNGGDMSGPEAMLVAQSHALDLMFSALANKAAANMHAGHLGATEGYLRLALKAQSQCRTTIEALGELKHPRTPTFIKQQNNASQQQVNNGGDTRSSTHACAPACEEKNITPTNELLSEGHHAGMDTRGAGATIGVNPELEAVGAVDRPH